MENNQYKEWTKVGWPYNQSLGHECWVKNFGEHKKIYVGIGDFLTVCFSAGPHSDRSFSTTRWRLNGIISEIRTMEDIDSVNGNGDKFSKLNTEPDLPRYEVVHKYAYPLGSTFHGEVADLRRSFQLRDSAERFAKEKDSIVKEIKPS